MIRSHPALALAMGVGLAGCAGPAPPSPAPSPAPTPRATAIDGVYRGTSTRFRADTRACPSPGLVILRVVDGVFEYRWNGHTRLDGTIAPDGTAQGALGDISLEARLSGGRIEGDVSNPSCAYHFRAVRREH